MKEVDEVEAVEAALRKVLEAWAAGSVNAEHVAAVAVHAAHTARLKEAVGQIGAESTPKEPAIVPSPCWLCSGAKFVPHDRLNMPRPQIRYGMIACPECKGTGVVQ